LAASRWLMARCSMIQSARVPSGLPLAVRPVTVSMKRSSSFRVSWNE
jgi:hypothetical protein